MNVDRTDSRHRRVRRPTPVVAVPTSNGRSRRSLVEQTVSGRQRASLGTSAKPDTRQIEILITQHMQALEDASSVAIRVKDTFLAVESAMKEADVKECRAGDFEAVYASSKGRASHTIDPASFYKLCKNKDDFFAAISVNAAEAKRILPTKELDGITTTVQGKDGAPTLRVGKVKAR